MLRRWLGKEAICYRREKGECRGFFWLCCQESQFPSVGLMHCFISNSVGFAQEQLSETITFNAEWNVFKERGFLFYFCPWWRRMCLRKLLSLMPSAPAAKTSVRLWSLYQMLLYAPQIISGIILSSKTIATAESEPENTHIVLSWARDVIFVLSSLVWVFLKAKAIWANGTCCLWAGKSAQHWKRWKMQLSWGSWIYAGVEQQVLDVEQFPKGGSQDREPCRETWSPSSTKWRGWCPRVWNATFCCSMLWLFDYSRRYCRLSWRFCRLFLLGAS